MSALQMIARVWRHAEWADAVLRAALAATVNPPAAALREYAHVIGAEEVWLARVDRRVSRVPVWPAMGLAELAPLGQQVREGYERLLARLDEDALMQRVPYTNSAGQTFETPLGDILLHVALHGQYHRGKVNLLMRQAGVEPAAVDFIAFARGVPAARQGGDPGGGNSLAGRQVRSTADGDSVPPADAEPTPGDLS
jgi:uncharacterized damage-inducible protein DinB